MDEFFLQLSELSRAGWTFEITPEPSEATLPSVRAAVLWSFKGADNLNQGKERVAFPLIDWINLFAPEIELRKAVAKMHERVFPYPPFGNMSV